MNQKIPVYEPVLGESSKANVIRCLETNWISSRGEFIEKFERAFAERIGSKHASSVSNGTVALHLALLALELGAGDEIIVPTFTYIASVNAISYVGATPVFVDSLPDTWQLAPADIEAKITDRTRAIMIVHLYGHPADNAAIIAIARKHGLKVIEDCAEAFGSYIGKTHVGNHGDIATFSFFGNKTITTGEGGMVTTNTADLDARVRKLKGQGLAGTREYWHDIVGYNYRMTNICAAIGLGQLELANDFLARKRHMANRINLELQGLPVSVLGETADSTNSFWMISIATDVAEQREPLRKHLASCGIETRPAFYPAHTMPMYCAYAISDYPVAVSLGSRGINLPSSPALTDDELTYVIDSIRAYFSSTE